MTLNGNSPLFCVFRISPNSIALDWRAIRLRHRQKIDLYGPMSSEYLFPLVGTHPRGSRTVSLRVRQLSYLLKLDNETLHIVNSITQRHLASTNTFYLRLTFVQLRTPYCVLQTNSQTPVKLHLHVQKFRSKHSFIASTVVTSFKLHYSVSLRTKKLIMACVNTM